MRKGFTLMELIIVVIIIGILAAIGIPQFFKIAERGKASEAITFLGALKSSQMRYASEHGTTTDTPGELDVEITSSALKYFENPTVNAVADPMTNSTDEIAEIVRKSDYQNPGFGDYTLAIQVDGQINCTPAGDHDVCVVLGY